MSFRNEGYGYLFTWSIENFTFCLQNKGEYFDSPTFPVDVLNNSEWRLRLYPKGFSDSKYISCYLANVCGLNGSEIILDCRISIVCVHGSSQFSSKITNQTFAGCKFHGFAEFAKRKWLVSRSSLLPKNTLTIRCEMAKLSDDLMLIKHFYIHTLISLDRISFAWTIYNFSNYQLKDKLRIPLAGTLEKFPGFVITIYLNGEALETAGVQIDITKISKLKDESNDPPTGAGVYSDCKVSLQAKVSILDVTGAPRQQIQRERSFSSCEADDIWHLPQFISRSDISNDKDIYLKNDALLLRFQFKLSNGVVSSLPAQSKLVYPVHKIRKKIKRTVYMDVQSLYTEKKYCDVTLIVGDTFYEAHKAVLSFWSSVFRSTFDCLKEVHIVEIDDVDFETLNKLLLFIYTDRLEDTLDLNILMKLYEASDKYKINSLKEQCSSRIQSNMSPENVWEVYEFACKSQDSILMTTASSFAADHPTEALVKFGY